MTTFKEIRGTTIEVVSSDPSNPELGQIWYNSSSGTLKGYVFATVNAWSAGGNLNTARRVLSGTGTQTAAVAAGGLSTVTTNATELYNGTSWSSSPASLTTARGNLGGTGTQSLGLVYGGLPFQTTTEEWTGPSTALQTKTITTS